MTSAHGDNAGGPTNDLPLTPEDVEEIVSILANSRYQTLDIETARFRLRISKNGDGWTQEWAPSAGPPPDAAAGPPPATPAGHCPGRQPDTADDGLLVIRPPLPGTFYRAPQPGAPPFVEVGDRVEPDTVVAIVETMKLMNSVHAGVSGEIVEIVPRNAEPIEADSVLMKVRPFEADTR